MASSTYSCGAVTLLAIIAALVLVCTPAAYGQISSPCTASMISSFTPCMNFITNSSANGTAPTADCCNALKTVTSGSMDCACLLVTGNVPFQLPINRTLAISLPRACNTPGVPLQCKAAATPLPAPGPGFSPASSPSLSPAGSTIPTTTSPAVSPATDDTPAALSPTSPTVTADSPAATTETRPTVTPSAANPSFRLGSSSLLLLGLGLVAAFMH